MIGRPADPVLAAAHTSALAGKPAVLVTIAAAKGSTPRVPGTRMLVDADRIVGSVGGGQLEFDIIASARALITQGATASAHQHFILGPDLRQCCGGALDIVLEPLAPEASVWLGQVIAWEQAGHHWTGSLTLSEPSSTRKLHRLEEAPTDPGTARLRKSESGMILSETSGVRWPQLYLFGAGHVGRALVNLLGDLPFHVIWSDGREGIFPDGIPDNVVIDAGAAYAEMIKAAPEEAHFLVMTHSHALDFEIVQAILQRGSFASLGLIGSDTKRARFLQRLRESGVPAVDLARLQCPIGLAGIKSKIPAAIAIAVAAELLLRPAVGMQLPAARMHLSG
ncbi:xanthine dehydrogenase accessory protein XdhC [Dongia mobilis]|jgi:xanthine dehydrogenase accessory factor|uniref:xanthine dehydrogenase accessory protein XdhC n=1 Tax=Dongia sp. TaxID=1977262 RepID=UPI0026F081ED